MPFMSIPILLKKHLDYCCDCLPSLTLVFTISCCKMLQSQNKGIVFKQLLYMG